MFTLGLSNHSTFSSKTVSPILKIRLFSFFLLVIISRLGLFTLSINNKQASQTASDGIEVGFKNKIPLWIFGFLY